MVWQGSIIAVDWGTTNRRAWRIGPDGAVEAELADASGIMSVPAHDFPAEAARLREALGDLPMLLGGMVGSDRGWRKAAYIACPVDARAIADRFEWIDGHTGIGPGFAVGVAASAEADLLARLFAVRAAHLLDAPLVDAAGYVSGLRSGGGEVPILIGRPELTTFYAATSPPARWSRSCAVRGQRKPMRWARR